LTSDDQRDAARQLIRTPLVLASRDPDGHRRIRRHADALARYESAWQCLPEPRTEWSIGSGS